MRYLPIVLLLILISDSGARVDAGASAHECVDLRTWNSRTVQNPDGTFTVEFSTGPMHYPSAAGWQPVDENWVGRSNTTNTIESHLPATADGAFEVRHEDSIVRWRAIGMGVAGTPPSAAAVYTEGNQASFEAWPGVEERYTVLPGKLKHETVLLAPPEPCDWLRFSYEFDTPPVADGAGLRVADLLLDPVFATDASGRRSRVDGRYVLEGNVLHVEVPGAWLLDPSRVYPVVIDPTLGPAASSMDTLIGSAFPAMSTFTEEELYVQNNGTEEERSLLQFDVSTLATASQINSASMALRVTTVSMPGSAPLAVSAHTVLKPWGAATTWTSADGTTAWSTAGARDAADSTPAAFATQTVAATVGTTVSFDMTATVTAWVTGTTNNGVLLSVDTPTGTFNDRGFGSREHATAANRPTLAVNYGSTGNPGTPGGTPTAVAGGGGGGGCSAGNSGLAYLALLLLAAWTMRRRQSA